MYVWGTGNKICEIRSVSHPPFIKDRTLAADYTKNSRNILLVKISNVQTLLFRVVISFCDCT